MSANIKCRGGVRKFVFSTNVDTSLEMAHSYYRLLIGTTTQLNHVTFGDLERWNLVDPIFLEDLCTHTYTVCPTVTKYGMWKRGFLHPSSKGRGPCEPNSGGPLCSPTEFDIVTPSYGGMFQESVTTYPKRLGPTAPKFWGTLYMHPYSLSHRHQILRAVKLENGRFFPHGPQLSRP